MSEKVKKVTLCFMDGKHRTISGEEMKISLEETVVQVGKEGKTWTFPLWNLRYVLFEHEEEVG